VYLERKSRLDESTCLLSQQLTLNELRNVASMLFTVAHKHDGIRRYLSKFSSGCIPKVVGVISAFFEYAKDSNTVNDAPIQDEKTSSSEVAAGTLQRTDAVQDSSGMVLLKVATAKTVYISHFTEDIYEQVRASYQQALALCYHCTNNSYPVFEIVALVDNGARG